MNAKASKSPGTPLAAAPGRRPMLGRALRSLAVVLLLAPNIAAALFIVAERRAAITDALAMANVVNDLAVGQIVRGLDGVDSVLHNTAQQLENLQGPDRDDPRRLFHLFQSTSVGVPQIRRLYLVGADDVIVATSTRPDPIRGNIGDRPYVQQLKRERLEGSVIAGPHAALDGDELLIHVARRLEDSQGGHRGTLAAAIRPEFFASIFATASRAPPLAGRLFLNDFVLIAAYPDRPEDLGRTVAPSPEARDLRAQIAAHGQLRTVSAVDGEDRLFDFRRIPGRPLLSAVSIRTADALAGWHRNAWPAAAATLLLSALLCAALFRLAREIDRREALHRRELAARDAERDAVIARAATQEKSQLLAAASHDLRQPLHAMRLFAAALLRRIQTGEQAELARSIARAADSMGSMFDALLDVARVEAGITRPRRQSMPLGPLLTQLGDEVAAELAGRPVAVTVVPTTRVIVTDPALFEVMLRNLVANAVRYTHTGRILIGCRRRAGRLIEIQVWDTGSGIALGSQGDVFERFTKLEAASATGRGLGLGLAIVRDLGRALGHPVTLRSREGRGSCFALTAPEAGSSTTMASTAATPAASPGDEPLRVVLLGSDGPWRTAADVALRDAGFDPFTCGEIGAGAQALDHPDAVLVCALDPAAGPADGLARDALDVIAELERRLRRAIDAVIVVRDLEAADLERLRRSGRPWLTDVADGERLSGAVLAARRRPATRRAG